jgi:hypothetical protein
MTRSARRGIRFDLRLIAHCAVIEGSHKQRRETVALHHFSSAQARSGWSDLERRLTTISQAA